MEMNIKIFTKKSCLLFDWVNELKLYIITASIDLPSFSL